ncbi:uncharacterized protein LOC115685284 isoform X2 [Syzygium oleosum]|uniref:uncharacterized protein LOC115685284 isoform X2 n=1 Tax=Syzygium oleosum TaxID=219896 RepID=UPI0024B9825D|nr:uncharacterized protein LOC115685284 isoform X2 [Syzygium oleosum]
MDWDAKEPDELELQSFSSASFSDHEISAEPPIDNVKEGTPPGNQNQTMEQESNPLSLDKLGKQNQTTEQDSNPLSLDELAPPRTFCDRFKTCLVSILECICDSNLS